MSKCVLFFNEERGVVVSIIKKFTGARTKHFGDVVKFKNAVLYFTHSCKPGTVGMVKLAKLLYYLDFDHYENYLEAITKSRYIGNY